MYDDRKRRWISKETVFSSWKELAGEYTASEIWTMRHQGRFAVAIPTMTNSKVITLTQTGELEREREDKSEK